MNAIRTTLIAALVAAVLVGTGGLAGAVTAAPGGVDAPNEADAGPPSDLPEPVPEFVGDILNSIGEFLSGGIEDLGDTVSDIAGNGTDDAPDEDGA